MSYNDISNLQVLLPSCLAEQNHLDILEDNIMRYMSEKLFLIWNSCSGGDFV